MGTPSNITPDRTPGLKEIKPGYYVYLHTDDTPGVSSTFNSGVIVTEEETIVIDALGSYEIAENVRKAISNVTDRPVRYLISCTYHRPFTGGNGVYRDVLRVGHENYRTGLLRVLNGASHKERIDSIPHITYRDGITIYSGGKEIKVLYMGRAHTDGDSIVYVPEDRIAFLSEIFNYEEFPYITDGYSAEWMETIEKIEKLPVDIFVPGHGFLPEDLGETRAGLRRHWQILKDVREAVKGQIDKRASLEETLNVIELPQYKRFKGYEKALGIAIRRIYRELTCGI
ncbi:MAG: MBL fold metallo-hydrolase [Syntrophorhabdaceae bacterium]|nr:MBL fold metallo-hydrolase [Syntrophorhabdaceae bacterium]